ncbi:hypothetical protein R3W88_033219 [Solanum pinnatisectum]|uniref:Uncharacterized protein n=1 Tax=Solanum pinnatisectum TaxID=50273 RepID=A0AAV9K1L6_9SOLN|nr:hypothetical protein R3W88_033219 [Solanum pinnatisectum]
MIWLGTFSTADEASESYKFKNLEFEELVMAKNAKKDKFVTYLMKNIFRMMNLNKNH